MKPFSLYYLLSMILTLSVTACATVKDTQSLVILPQDCSVPVSKDTALTLSGQIDPNSHISWQADFGSIVQNPQGLSATYLAPSVPGVALITATVTSGIDASSTVLTVSCKVNDLQSITLIPNTPAVLSTGLLSLVKPTIIISEVMGNPCGDMDQRMFNQYVELYNYGNQPVDVGGWWLYDEGSAGTPDQLTSWNKRSSFVIANDLILDSTIIPAGGVAVILSPEYPKNIDIEKMPYRFPAGTLIFTVAVSDTLGDDFFGIIADQNGYDTLTLYTGSISVIDSVVDTYGTPLIPSVYPFEIQDDHNDNIPTYLSDCSSIERINPHTPDAESNWKTVLNGTPGEAPYNK